VLSAGLLAGQHMGWISIFPASVTRNLDKGLGFFSDSARSGPVSAPSIQETTRTVLPAPQHMKDASGPASNTVAENPKENAEPTSAPAPAAQVAPVPVSPSAEALSAPAAMERQVPNAGDELILKLREDSWIEIRKSDNSAVISRLVKAGSTESFKLTGPVSLNIGNVKGVDATLRGAPLELRARAKNNVARLRLK